MRQGPMSNGMLRAMSDEQRRATIADLSPDVRRRLAHIAALGLERILERIAKHLAEDHRKWADSALTEAREFARLVIELDPHAETEDPHREATAPLPPGHVAVPVVSTDRHRGRRDRQTSRQPPLPM